MNLTSQYMLTDAGSVQVREGAIISAVYIEMWILAGSSQPGSFTISLEKRIGGQPAMTFLNSATLDSYPNKKNILYTTQGLSPDANGNPVPIMRGWYKIPKGKQRFGLSDSLILNMSANVEDMSHCGVFIYKEQY